MLVLVAFVRATTVSYSLSAIKVTGTKIAGDWVERLVMPT